MVQTRADVSRRGRIPLAASHLSNHAAAHCAADPGLAVEDPLGGDPVELRQRRDLAVSEA